jgi:hypothetical protein
MRARKRTRRALSGSSFAVRREPPLPPSAVSRCLLVATAGEQEWQCREE